jgi:hypothetical protein
MTKQAEFDTITAVPVSTQDNVRLRIEAAIESHLDAAETLILKLDETDGDPDFCASEHDGREPDEDLEPSLGWTFAGEHGELRPGDKMDLEQECEDEGACETAFPCL